MFVIDYRIFKQTCTWNTWLRSFFPPSVWCGPSWGIKLQLLGNKAGVSTNYSMKGGELQWIIMSHLQSWLASKNVFPNSKQAKINNKCYLQGIILLDLLPTLLHFSSLSKETYLEYMDFHIYTQPSHNAARSLYLKLVCVIPTRYVWWLQETVAFQVFQCFNM